MVYGVVCREGWYCSDAVMVYGVVCRVGWRVLESVAVVVVAGAVWSVQWRYCPVYYQPQ